MVNILRLTFLIFFLNLPGKSVYSQNADWHQTNCPGAQGRFDDISLPNINNIWVLGFSGDLYKSSDEGLNWSNVVGPPSGSYRSILFTDSLNGFIGCLGAIAPDTTILYATSDGGNTWNPKYIPIPPGAQYQSGICGMCSVEDSVIYGCGRFWGPARIYKSTDYGQNWQTIDLSNQAFGLVDIYFWSKDSGIVVGSTDTSLSATYANAAIFRTTDGGNNWQLMYESSMPEEWCWKISSPQQGYFYVSVEQSSIGPRFCLKSTDYGLTWNEMQYAYSGSPVTSQYVSQGIGFRTINEGWVCVNNTLSVPGSVFHTTDGGTTWVNDTIEWALNRMRFLNDSTGFACGISVWKYSSTGIVNVAETEVKNMRVYPTVSDGLITIEFSDEKNKVIELISWNGQKIDEFKTSSRKYICDLTTYNAGVYFILASSDGYYASEKIMLIK